MREGELWPGDGSEYGADGEKLRLERRDNMVTLTIVYPERPAPVIELDQESVRASDGIRVYFDYDRDGWAVLRPDWAQDPGDPPWIETGFFESWALRPALWALF